MKFFSKKPSLALKLALPMVLGTLFIGLFVIFFSDKWVETTAETEVKKRAELLVSAITLAADGREGTDTLKPLVNRLGTSGDVLDLFIVSVERQQIVASLNRSLSGLTVNDIRREDIKTLVQASLFFKTATFSRQESSGNLVYFAPIQLYDEKVRQYNAFVVVIVLDLSEEFAELTSTFSLFSKTLVTGLIATMLFSLAFMHFSVARPVTELLLAMEQRQKGDKQAVLSIKGDDEISRIARLYVNSIQSMEGNSDLLSAIKHRFDAVLMASGEGVCGFDEDGVVTFVNPVACRILKASQERLVGQPIRLWLVWDDKNAHGKEAAHINAVYALKDKNDVGRVDTDAFRRLDGSPVPVEYSAEAITEKGNIVGGVIIFRDISEAKDLY